MSDRLRQLYWVIPAPLVGSLVAGILFAVGHLVFYSSLKGSAPPVVDHSVANLRISGQVIDLAAGNTLALLVRFCLSLAISSSYTQLVWYAIKRSTHSRTVVDIDRITITLSNLLIMFDVTAWFRWPFLLPAALSSW